MFTGIVRACSPVFSIQEKEGGRTITIRLGNTADKITQNLENGASIAVNGTCLTLVSFVEVEGFVLCTFDVIQETLNRTNLGELKVEDRVNIERSMKYGDEIGGHQVSGHVDCVGCIESRKVTPNNTEMYFSYKDTKWDQFIIPKGWIAVDGISLTVVDVQKNKFSVSLIPETLARTTLGFKKEGDCVNLEFDAQTKTIVLTMQRLIPKMLQDYLKGQKG